MNKDLWKERFARFRNFASLKHKKRVIRGARITYSVVWNICLLFIIFGLIGFSFAGGVGAGYFASLVKDEPIRSYESMEKMIYNYEETSELYFDNEVFLGKLRSDIDRQEISIDEMSDHLIQAVIATEDEYFYEHNGVVPKAILRALFQEVTNSSSRSGGSTLTQQLIKNQILTSEVSFDRKAKEILLALRLEQTFDKDEILEAYLNVATFGRNSSGRNIAGVQTAAQGIFDVDAKDLNIAQAAFIAGLPQSPFGYTPFSNDGGKLKQDLSPGLNRMKIVLSRMLEKEFINEEEYQQALDFDIVGSFASPKESSLAKYPYLSAELQYRAKEILTKKLAENDGYEEEDLEADDELNRYYRALADQNLRQNGYKIYSTIDKEIYENFQKVVKEYEYYGNDKVETKTDPDTGKTIKVVEPVETGAVLIENSTGKIISFVGGRDFQREQTNHATSPRPNGSTMKPLLVFAPAIESGIIQPGSVILDVPMTGSWKPDNYGGGYHGFTSARNALQWSYNIPAAKTYLNLLNSGNPVSYLEQMGFSSLVPDDYTNPSMSLGAMTDGVTVEENVNAYATFGNMGKFVDAYMIEKIETNDGVVIYEHESAETDVFSPQTAYLTLDMMRDVVQRGTAASMNGYLKFSSDWAGKTGTGQNYRDAWFVATNPNVTFGTWIGYDTPKRLDISYKNLSYSKRNILLWSQLMNAAYDIRPDLIDPEERFKMPGGIVSRSYCAISGMLPSELCQQAGLVKTDLFNSKYVPTEVDDNLVKGKYVVVNDKAYRVPATAPAEFVKEGVMIKKSFLDDNDITVENLLKYLPNSLKVDNLIVTDEKEQIKDNGSVPSKVTGLTIQSNELSWAAHSHHDIIGYRVYAANNFSANFKKITSVIATKELRVTIPDKASAYYVTAVDVDGNESPASDIMKHGDWIEEKPAPVEKEPTKETPANENKLPDNDQKQENHEKEPNNMKPENS